MRSIKISDEVWQALASQGKFGETEDDVLRRVFGLDTRSEPEQAQRSRYAERRISPIIDGNSLVVRVEDGPESRFALPARTDKPEIKKTLDEAIAFASKHGASLGQVNYIRKRLTEAGYHLTK